MHYYEYVAIDADDQTIACHPLIDACNGSIAYRLLEHLGIPCEGRVVLDLGAGTGQVSRFLQGIPGITVEALDEDLQSRQYFRHHPELNALTFYSLNFLTENLPRHYDAIICRGVYHHIPKSERPAFLKRMAANTHLLIIADEGILEYSSEEERRRNCATWYGFVIAEAQRRGLDRLAEMETLFLEHEQLASADDGLDFKESPTHLLLDAADSGLTPASIDRQGPWEQLGGGFFTATFVISNQRG